MPKFGFPKKARLRRESEFKAVYNEGAKVVDQLVVLFYRPNGLDITRLGLAVSRRLGKPVVRNRIKRLLREFFRLNRWRMQPGIDIVLVARRGMIGLKYQQVAQQLEGVFLRAGIWQPADKIQVQQDNKQGLG